MWDKQMMKYYVTVKMNEVDPWYLHVKSQKHMLNKTKQKGKAQNM